MYIKDKESGKIDVEKLYNLQDLWICNIISKQYLEGCDLMLELEEANLTLKEYEKKLNELRDSLWHRW